MQPVEGGIEGWTEGDNVQTLWTDGVESPKVPLYGLRKVHLNLLCLRRTDKLFYAKNDVNTSGLITIPTLQKIQKLM